MKNQFDVSIENNFRKLKIVLMLHRNNRQGYGNINLEINNNIQTNYINISYKKLIDLKTNLNSINDDITKINTDIKNNDNDITKINDDITKINTDIKNNDNDITEINDDITKINTDIKNNDNDITKINDDITKINTDISNINNSKYLIDDIFINPIDTL